MNQSCLLRAHKLENGSLKPTVDPPIALTKVLPNSWLGETASQGRGSDSSGEDFAAAFWVGGLGQLGLPHWASKLDSVLPSLS